MHLIHPWFQLLIPSYDIHRCKKREKFVKSAHWRYQSVPLGQNVEKKDLGKKKKEKGEIIYAKSEILYSHG